MSKIQKINSSENSIYNMSLRTVLAIILASLCAFVLGLSLNFSLHDKLTSMITSQVKQNRKCPMDFKELGLNYFMPSLTLTDFSVSQRCLNSLESLKISSVNTHLSLPSFSPLGPSLTTTIKDAHSSVEIISVHGIFNHHFKISSARLSSKTFSPLLGNFKLGGNFSLNSDIGVSTTALRSLNLQLKSMNFSIPTQTIEGFEVPNLTIGPLSLKAEMLEGSNKLSILEMILGNELSPIRANIKGSISLEQVNIKKSKVDLIATVKFSASFLESFSILNLFLDATKQDEDGFYKIKITGTLNKLDKPVFLN